MHKNQFYFGINFGLQRNKATSTSDVAFQVCLVSGPQPSPHSVTT